jgi:hypothetical protein
VAGSALCLHNDLARARAIVGDVPVIAVNAAAKEVKAVALFSQHPERFKSFRWIERQAARFGAGFTVHGCKARPAMPWVDHWWEDARGGGSSAWGARKLAWLMGFDPVILCGAPLEPMAYVNHGIPQLMGDARTHEDFHRAIEAEPEWHEGVFSMSGWTREKFGEPR